MPDATPASPFDDHFRRRVLLTVIAVGLIATDSAWYLMSMRAPLSPAVLLSQLVTTVVLAALLAITWWRWLPQRVVELCCLLYIVAVCVACMALRMYSPRYGAGIHFEPLYLWIPTIYLFAFMLTSHKRGLLLSLAILAIFVITSAPYLVRGPSQRDANFTVQLLVVSAFTIVLLYFFSSYQHRLRLAQQTVGELAQLSNTDELTGLSNRRHMAKAIRAALGVWTPDATGFAVLLFDIDHFKLINDRHGHTAGDRTMVALAACASEVFGGLGIVGRWGGDEFIVMVPDTGADDAVRMASALCAHVATSGLADGRQVTISCGVTVARARDSLDSLLQRVDAALYNAKRAGRNRAESIVEANANVVAL